MVKSKTNVLNIKGHVALLESIVSKRVRSRMSYILCATHRMVLKRAKKGRGREDE